MKRIATLTCWTLLLLASSLPAAAQRRKAIRTRADCSQPLLTQVDQALSDSLQRYLQFVGDYEIPVLVRQPVDQTMHYYLTAFIATYTIKLNPPTALVLLNGRETLFYEEGKVGAMLTSSPPCWQYLLQKYSYLLHTDKLNRINKRPPSSADEGSIYDPVSIELIVNYQGQIRRRSPSDIPIIKWR